LHAEPAGRVVVLFFGVTFFVVDVDFGAAIFDDVLLAGRVDADDAHAHAARGDLDGDVAELKEEELSVVCLHIQQVKNAYSASGSEQSDPVSAPCA
jgi:hypothetical protein